eukprot:3679433-Amphidinium_carterae.1
MARAVSQAQCCEDREGPCKTKHGENNAVAASWERRLTQLANAIVILLADSTVEQVESSQSLR